VTIIRQPAFLLGPSSVGKSLLSTTVASQLDLETRESDELGDPALRQWPVVRQWLQSFEDRPLLVDLGAGTQHSCRLELERYLAPRRERVVLIMDDAERAFQRNLQQGHRTLLGRAEYIETEYTSRKDLYTVADWCIDCRELTQSEALRRLAIILQGLLPTNLQL